MFKFLKSSGKFLAECSKAAINGLEKFNEELDAINQKMEQYNKKQSIRMASTIADLNCVLIKVIPNEFNFCSVQSIDILNELHEYFSSCKEISDRADNSNVASDLIISSPDLVEWFDSFKKLQITREGYQTYLNKINDTNAGTKSVNKEMGVDNSLLIALTKSNSPTDRELLVINFIFSDYLGVCVCYEQIEVEVMLLNYRKNNISKKLFGG